MVVGADRVVANGDTANKVGTYQLAIAAKHHGIPFYVAAPSTSCDLSLESGRDIVIEVRPPEELTSINGVPIAAPGKNAPDGTWVVWESKEHTKDSGVSRGRMSVAQVQCSLSPEHRTLCV